MIATLAEIKTLLGISGTTKDNVITANIPIVENYICNYCKDDFVEYTNRIPSTPRVYLQSNEVQFVNSTNSLDSSTVDLSTYRWVAGDNLRIYGSYHNEKVLTISSVASGSIVFDSTNTVTDENYGDTLTIVRVVYPEDLKKVYSFMINYNINKDNLKGLESEKILGYSYKLSATNYSGYPDSAMNELNTYRKILKRPLFNANSTGVLHYGY